jgi:2'-5' RNA ligase
MAKAIQKYFIAVVPEGSVQEKVTDIKLELLKQFNLKYALKSPAHITLKMPFLWNQAKEEKLIKQLETACQDVVPFVVELNQFDRFGQRVIFVNVKESDTLLTVQKKLVSFCKTNLKLHLELSDINYHPHMTIAFKDLKQAKFFDYWSFVKPLPLQLNFEVNNIALLKKITGTWEVIERIKL